MFISEDVVIKIYLQKCTVIYMCILSDPSPYCFIEWTKEVNMIGHKNKNHANMILAQIIGKYLG